jgi:hypothetical protein
MAKLWDLSAGTAKLELAMDTLKKTTRQTEDRWDDETFRSFVKTHLEPLEPRVQRAVEAIHRVAQVLARAERECGSY